VGAILYYTDFSGAKLDEANFYNAILGRTEFVDVDLSTVNGLEGVNHKWPSTIDLNTLIKSKGKIPQEFLRDAGVTEKFINFAHSLLIKSYYNCFISYSSKDQAFAERLHADLQNEGVPCWFAPEDMKIGDKIRPSIDEAIRIHDKLLLVLSEDSVASAWVEKEVESAFEKERLQQKLVLIPIRLDDTVMRTRQAWAADIRRTRHIGDFTHWKNHDDYQKAFNRLLRDLKAEAQTMESRDSTTNGG
jgi:hypothetical protein